MKPHNDTIETLRLFGLASFRNEQIKPIEALRKCKNVSSTMQTLQWNPASATLSRPACIMSWRNVKSTMSRALASNVSCEASVGTAAGNR